MSTIEEIQEMITQTPDEMLESGATVDQWYTYALGLTVESSLLEMAIAAVVEDYQDAHEVLEKVMAAPTFAGAKAIVQELFNRWNQQKDEARETLSKLGPMLDPTEWPDAAV